MALTRREATTMSKPDRESTARSFIRFDPLAAALAATLLLGAPARAHAADGDIDLAFGPSASGAFGTKTDYPGLGSSAYVALRDLNGDGHPDLVLASYTVDSILVRLGNGSGGFGAATEFPANLAATGMAMGDVNGDGHPDVVTSNSVTSTISVLLGNGSGGFGPQTDYVAGYEPQAIALGDVNGDGHLDVVVVSSSLSTVSVLLGDGTGAFGPRTDFATGHDPVSLGLADLNGDGHLDIVVANAADNTVSVLLGNGSGGFGAKTDFATASSPCAIAIGDLNRDGHPDVVVADAGSASVSVLLGNGTGGLGPKADFATESGPASIAIGDLDRDGLLDVVVANPGSASISVLRGDGSGGLGARMNSSTGSYPSSVAIGDLNADAFPDIVSANQTSNDTSVLLSNHWGRVLTDFSSSTDAGYGVALQSDGRIVVAGQTGNDFALARYNTDGSLDGTFGAGGKVSTDFTGGLDSGRGVAVQSDGRIVVAGYTTLDFALARYNANGALDATFGSGGKVTTDFFGSLDRAFAVALQGDGRIVAAGFAYDLMGHTNFAVARYNTNGSLDATFGGGGKFTYQFTGVMDAADAVAIQPDGKILVAGRAGNAWGIIRVNADGSGLDPTFGSSGHVSLFTGDANTAGAGEVLVQPDGEIVGVGVTIDATKDFALARFSPAGALDVLGFGAPTGEVTKDFAGGVDAGQSAALQGDGKIVAAGVATIGGGSDFALARFGTDGSLDAGFHGTGGVTTDFEGLADVANAVAIQTDGKIVAAGTATTPTGTDFALVRYLASSATVGVAPPAGAGVARLAPAYPNPARGSASIDFELQKAGAVRLAVFDVTGRLVRTLVDAPLAAGSHSVRWDGRSLSGEAAGPGLYFYELRADGGALRQKVVLVR